VIEAFRRISEQRAALKAGVFLVSTVQEEVGLRGAQTSAYSIDPQIAVAVDVTFTSDHPGTSKAELGDVRINGGPVLSVGGHVNPRVYQLLIKAAQEAGLAYQVEAHAGRTGTDADMIQVTRGGVATAVVSIPNRYMHTGSEVVSLKDIDGVAETLARFVLALDVDTNLIP
jgi:endoglucanase